MVRRRCGVRSVSGAVALADRIRLHGLWSGGRTISGQSGTLDVPSVWPSGLGDRRDDLREDAHAGTPKKDDAEDLLDFTTALRERLYTEPMRLEFAQKRRDKRRGNAK